jgi:hypothetical protein
VKAGLAVARAWILLATPPGTQKGSTRGQITGSERCLPGSSSLNQNALPTWGHSSLALEVNP